MPVESAAFGICEHLDEHRKRPEDKSLRWQPRKSIRLYLDDIEDIFVVLTGISPEAHGETSEFAGIKSAQELRELGDAEIRNLVLRAPTPAGAVTVSLSERTAISIPSRDENTLLGALTRLQQIFVRCQRSFGFHGSRLTSPPSVLALAMAVGSFIDFHVTTVIDQDVTIGVFFGSAVFLLSVAGLDIFGTNPRPEALVIAKRRSEAPSFWQANRTAILISLATKVIVAGVFFLIGVAVR